MKDLQDTTDADLVRVNVISIGAIFLIIMIIFKSISLPIILVAVIEFAILSIWPFRTIRESASVRCKYCYWCHPAGCNR